jgi:hypothetical protein
MLAWSTFLIIISPPPFVSLTLSTILERGWDREEKGWEEVSGCEGGRVGGRERDLSVLGADKKMIFVIVSCRVNAPSICLW